MDINKVKNELSFDMATMLKQSFVMDSVKELFTENSTEMNFCHSKSL